MATKTFYLLNTAATTPNWNGSMQDGGTAPSAAASAFGWGPAKTAVTTPYFQGRIGATATVTTASATSYISGATGPLVGTGATNTTASDSFVSPTPYTGVFAAGNWTFTFGMRATTAGAIGHINVRVWAGTNRTGSGARSLAASQLGATITLSTTATTNSTVTWAAPAVTLINEYLFIQVEWQETTAGSSNNNNILFYQSGATILTTDFQPAGPLVATDIIDTSAISGLTAVLGTLAATDPIDTTLIFNGKVAAKVYYFLSANGASPNWAGSLQDGGTAPSGSIAAFGFQPGNLDLTHPYYPGYIGGNALSTGGFASSYILTQTYPRVGSSLTAPSDYFISPAALTGAFAAENWVLNFAFQCTTVGAIGRPNFRLLKGPNINASGAVDIVTNFQSGAIVVLNATATTFISSQNVAVPAVTFNNEYIFIEIEWQETVQGTDTNSNALFYQGGSFITAAFTSGYSGTLAVTDIIDTANISGSLGVFGSLTVTEAIDTAALAGSTIAACTWNPADLLGVTLGNSNLSATSRASL